MSQVSKYLLNKEVEERMYDIFWQTIARLTTKESVKKFFYDLLSSTEKVMLAKRLAIAILLLKNYDYLTISKTLRVSTSTIMLISTWLKNGGEGYKMVIKRILTEEKAEEFWDNLGEKIDNLLPPNSRGNWGEIRSRQWKERISRNHKRTL